MAHFLSLVIIDFLTSELTRTIFLSALCFLELIVFELWADTDRQT